MKELCRSLFSSFRRRPESRKCLEILDTGLRRYDKGAEFIGLCKGLDERLIYPDDFLLIVRMARCSRSITFDRQ